MTFNEVSGGYLQLLSDGQIQTLHESSLRVLQDTGVIIEHKEMLDILSSRGAKVDWDKNLVRFDPDMVEFALDNAPKEMVLYGREEGKEIVLKDDTVHTHTGGGPIYLKDVSSGERRKALKEDCAKSAKLADALDNIHSYVPLVNPTDVNGEAVEMEMVDSTIRNTSKFIANPVMSDVEVEFMYDLFLPIAGDEETLEEKPLFGIFPSPLSPLYYQEDIVRAFMVAAKKSIPTIILPCPTSGGSAPLTFAGALAQQNAELLAGLTIIQLVNPGSPVVLGPRLSFLDMQTATNTWGNPELGMASASAVQIIQSYGIPSDVYGLCSDSNMLDQQLGYERAINTLTPAFAGADFISGAGRLASGKGASYEQLVIDNEILGMIMKVLKKFDINEDTLALDLINRVGPKGHFTNQKHTAKYARSGEIYSSSLTNRLSWEDWLKGGKKSIVEVAEEEVKRIFEEHKPKPLEKTVKKELDETMNQIRSYYGGEQQS